MVHDASDSQLYKTLVILIMTTGFALVFHFSLKDWANANIAEDNDATQNHPEPPVKEKPPLLPSESREIGAQLTITVLADMLRENYRILGEATSLLQKLNFDKIGLPDYAAARFGGEVVSVITNPSGGWSSMLSGVVPALFSMSYYRPTNKPHCMLQDCASCYAYEGYKAEITIKLVTVVNLQSVTIEHFPAQMIPDIDSENSAIKEFMVWGLADPKGQTAKFYFGMYKFDYRKSFIDTFTFTYQSDIGYRYVRIEVVSNHGTDYTCIYRIRIHGTVETLMASDGKASK